MEILQKEKKLLNDTTVLCIKNGISLRLLSANSIRGGNFGTVYNKGKKCSFSFAFPANETYHNIWSSFLHESCHVDQFIENGSLFDSFDGSYERKIFKKYEHPPYNFPEDYFKGIGTKRDGRIYFQEVLKREIDCDIRALKKIKERNLNIDKLQYIYDSVLYHYYHVWIWKNRRECKLGMDYGNLENQKKFPKKLLTVDEYWNTFDDLGLEYE